MQKQCGFSLVSVAVVLGLSFVATSPLSCSSLTSHTLSNLFICVSDRDTWAIHFVYSYLLFYFLYTTK